MEIALARVKRFQCKADIWEALKRDVDAIDCACDFNVALLTANSSFIFS